MPLEVKMHNGSPRFSGIDVIGKRIFDLTLAARIKPGTSARALVERIQNEARASVPHAHVLPLDQVHVTVVNPVFKTGSEHELPSVYERNKLFDKFLAVLRSPEARAILSAPVATSFGEILVRQRDVKLMAGQGVNPIADLQAGIEAVLRQEDPRFDFQEGHPSFHTTLLRFGPNFSDEDHEAVMDIVRGAARDIGAVPLDMEVTLENLFAVEFDGLFEAWTKEAAIA